MITKRDPAVGGIGTGLAILAVGIAIGLLLQPEQWFDVAEAADTAGATDETGEPEFDPGLELHENLEPSAVPDVVPSNRLETLTLTIDRTSANVLQRTRDHAINRGIIVQTPESIVPALVEHGGEEVGAEVRLKGDWTDHVKTDKWSLRIKLLDGKLMGMRVFSVQGPKTRGLLWEWLVLEAARREGVLAPRATFVNVVVNGNYAGVYYLEEHFSKELLESQGRRDGPVVRWDENTRWSSLLQLHSVYSKRVRLGVPESAKGALRMGPPFVSAYGEERLGAMDALNRSFHGAVEEMQALQNLVQLSDSGVDRLRRLQALEDLQGRTIERLVEVDRLASAHALASLFQIKHSLYWQNMRFYHDPVLDRLEPILFDNMAKEPASRDPVVFRLPSTTPPFAKSSRYYNGVFEELGRFCEKDYLDDLVEAIGSELEVYEAAVDSDEGLAGAHTVDGMLQRLRAQQAYLRKVLYPVDPISFSSVFELEGGDRSTIDGFMEVTAWGTTRTPVVVEGFRFSNGKVLPARTVLDPEAGGTSSARSGGVVLPPDGRSVTFRVPMDERLANLENVGQMIDELRAPEEVGRKGLDLDVDVLFRPVAAPEDDLNVERLRFRRRDPAWELEGRRPDPPTLAEALERHPFLEYQPEQDRLHVMEGTWDVVGDLVVPSGLTLHAEGPVTLRFEEGAVLLTDAPLDFGGNWTTKVVLEPIDGAESWSGVVVLKASGRSTWEHVTVRGTREVMRSGWVTTGGVTFYHSPVSMELCRFEGSLAEDALNVFGTDVVLDRVKFVGNASDSFDGDHVTGTIQMCTFREGLGDGVDLSGSQVEVIDCTFYALGDKAVSVGERSDVRVRAGLFERTPIGIASKDGSVVHVEGATIRLSSSYALAAYVKKREFGPSRLIARGVGIEGSGLGDTIVQTGCVLEVEGVLVPTTDLDVEALYREKILGR
jgi:hypothetical protein